MKKKIGLVLLFILSVTLGTAETVDASNSLSQYTKNFIEEIVCIDENECVGDKLVIRSEKIYDVFLQDVGKIYEYEYLDQVGYVISRKTKIDNEWVMEIVEASTDTVSPYFRNDSKNVYLSYGLYFEYKNKKLENVLTGEETEYSDFMDYLNSRMYIGAMGTSSSTLYTYEYSYYSMSSSRTETDGGFPTLSTDLGDGVTNNCSPTAGTEIIMYWDRYETNLISNFTPTYLTLVGTPPYSYYYVTNYRNWSNITSSQLSTLEALHDDLYDDMYTNNYTIPFFGDGAGTYPPFFFDALEDYFSAKNLTLEHNNLVLGPGWGFNTFGSQIDREDYQDEIDLDYPVVIQLGVDPSMDYELYYDSYSIEYDDTYFYTYYGQKIWYDTISRFYREYSNSAHTVVGYGYMSMDFYKINYYGNLYKSRTDKYFVVANGWGGTSLIKSTNSDVAIAYSVYPS